MSQSHWEAQSNEECNGVDRGRGERGHGHELHVRSSGPTIKEIEARVNRRKGASLQGASGSVQSSMDRPLRGELTPRNQGGEEKE